MLRPEGFALPPRSWTRRAPPPRPRAARSARPRTAPRRSRAPHVLYAKEWGSHDALRRRRRRCALRADLADWCVRDDWFDRAATDCRLMHCLPVRRNVAVADEVLDGAAQRRAARGLQPSGGADGRAAPHAERQLTRMIKTPTPDPAAATIRALRAASAATSACTRARPSSSRRAAPCSATTRSTRALIEQVAILHQFGIKVVLVHGGGPQLTQVRSALGIETRMVDGRRVTDQQSIDVDRDGAERPRSTPASSAICRELDIEAVGCQRRRRGPDSRAPAAAGAPRPTAAETVDYGFVGDIDSINTERDREAARRTG